MAEVSLAVQLGMTPSEFRRRATVRDFEELLAHAKAEAKALKDAKKG